MSPSVAVVCRRDCGLGSAGLTNEVPGLGAFCGTQLECNLLSTFATAPNPHLITVVAKEDMSGLEAVGAVANSRQEIFPRASTCLSSSP